MTSLHLILLIFSFGAGFVVGMVVNKLLKSHKHNYQITKAYKQKEEWTNNLRYNYERWNYYCEEKCSVCGDIEEHYFYRDKEPNNILIPKVELFLKGEMCKNIKTKSIV